MAPKKAPDPNINAAQDSPAFQVMFDVHPAILLLVEPHTGEILDANPAAAKFYGHSREWLRSRHLNELETVTPMKARGFNPEKQNFVATHLLENGDERLVQVYLSPLELHDRQVLFAIIQDITALNQKDAMRRAERDILLTLLDNLPDRIYVKDVFGRKIISNTADWRASGGKTVRDVLGKSDFETYSPELAAKFWADDQSVLLSGEPVINREEPGLDSDGNPSWVLTTKVPLKDENGKVTGLMGVGRDITERKKVDDELHESRQLFHLLIENLPQNIYAKDLDGRFIFANQHFCDIQRLTLAEIIGKTDFELHPFELAEKYRADDRRVLETGKVLELEEDYMPVNGQKFIVQVIKTPFFNSRGQTAGTMGIFWDISDRKRAESELNKARDQLEKVNQDLQQSFMREMRLARLDELTGINNRRSLLEYAEHDFSIAIRYGSPLSIIIFDIDNFKSINDNYGHALGDQVLENLAQRVSAELRISDIIGRYGGDEFVILLPQTGEAEAFALAGRIQACVSGMVMDTGKGPLSITLSIGLSQTMLNSGSTPPRADKLKDLFQRADQALYAAKHAGKNCIKIVRPE